MKIGEEPEGVTIRPDGKVVYVTSEDDGAVFAIDTATNKVLKRMPVGPRPRSIGFLPDGSRAYVSLENDGAIAVIDAQAAEVPAPDHSSKARARRRSRGRWASPCTPTARRCTSPPARSVTCSSSIRRRSRRPTSIEVGQRPWGIALLPGGKTASRRTDRRTTCRSSISRRKQVVKKITRRQRGRGACRRSSRR